MNLRKILTLVSCVALLVCISVGATLAYLQDKDVAVNTFTIGDVDIIINEADVGEDGKPKGDARVQENTYKLRPGLTYTKDPTITVIKESEDCYVRTLVTVNNIDALKNAFPQTVTEEAAAAGKVAYPTYYGDDGVFLLQMLVNGWDNNVWAFESYTNGTYEFRYVGTKANNGVIKYNTANVELEPLFKEVKVPGTVDNVDLSYLNNVTITVTGQAIQADGFGNAADAWVQFSNVMAEYGEQGV